MGKRGTTQKKKWQHQYADPPDMDDEIDAFHKQRDIIPLDVNDDEAESTEDDELPVLHDKDIDYDDDDDSENDDDAYDTGLAAKIAKQQKFLRSKFGGSDDEMDEEDADKKRIGWGGRKDLYYGGDEHSSDDDAAMLEEEEARRIMKERAQELTEEDFGLENHEDIELNLEEISAKGKALTKTLPGKETVADIGALSAEEQMVVVYSTAPELLGLLSELNDAVEQLERLDSLINKFKVGVTVEAVIRYLEVKQLLLVAYCQAITFYLLLKSKGHSVRDHPVIARLVEIKGLIDKVKELDGIPDLEDFVKENSVDAVMLDTTRQKGEPVLQSDRAAKGPASSAVLANRNQKVEPEDSNQMAKVESLRNNGRKETKHSPKHDQVAVQSTEMLKLRAALEEKLKQKRSFNSLLTKPDKSKKQLKQVNGQLETYDDFDDEATDVKSGSHTLVKGDKGLLGLSKLSQLVAAKSNMSKVISGDDDIPKRDDIGERRRKHELKVLAGAGITSENDGGEDRGFVEAHGLSDGENNVEHGTDVSEDEFYKQVKEKRAERLAIKKQMYSRLEPIISSKAETVDGKRLISTQIEKNRGLTRKRKRENKNPRKKYRNKHDKAVKRRKGQVREIKKPIGPYGGEATGINVSVSRSIRF